MNERIDELISRIGVNDNIIELAKQAGCKIDTLGYGEGNLEKFAELLVKECCYIVGDYYGQSKKSGPGYTMICEIKEHFGIEE